MGPIEPGFYYFYSFLLISNNTLQPRLSTVAEFYVTYKIK